MGKQAESVFLGNTGQMYVRSDAFIYLLKGESMMGCEELRNDFDANSLISIGMVSIFHTISDAAILKGAVSLQSVVSAKSDGATNLWSGSGHVCNSIPGLYSLSGRGRQSDVIAIYSNHDAFVALMNNGLAITWGIAAPVSTVIWCRHRFPASRPRPV